MSTPPAAPDAPDTVTVTGSAIVGSVTDRVRLVLGVQVVRPEPGEAFATAARTVTELLAVLADNGVDARAVRTQDLQLGPQTRWEGDREVMLGYQASQRLAATVEDLTSVERLLSQVVARSGPGIRIDEVTLVSHDTDAALARARELAVADARTRAEHYAALTGRTLGRVLAIDETPSAAPVHRRAPKVEALAAASMPIATGDTELGVTLTVRYELR